ncbi:DUF5615 family PIN-like protein [Aeromicrobium sp. UC242_57]|uniref:DUF5615 family PIN-like protein n=1 Tax=Aeromicrobium sp. UC242_57 TaxID=3374624 RepID=UPI0037A594B9
MRFLLDECISARLASFLEQAGHDVTHVLVLGLQGCPDVDVLCAARDEQRVLISSDTDFGELLANSAASMPSVVLFRQGNRGPEHQAEVLLANLEAVVDDLDNGSIVVFTDDRIRIRRLPIT